MPVRSDLIPLIEAWFRAFKPQIAVNRLKIIKAETLRMGLWGDKIRVHFIADKDPRGTSAEHEWLIELEINFSGFIHAVPTGAAEKYAQDRRVESGTTPIKPTDELYSHKLAPIKGLEAILGAAKHHSLDCWEDDSDDIRDSAGSAATSDSAPRSNPRDNGGVQSAAVEVKRAPKTCPVCGQKGAGPRNGWYCHAHKHLKR